LTGTWLSAIIRLRQYGCGRLAQPGERRVRNAEAGGSIPPPSTNIDAGCISINCSITSKLTAPSRHPISPAEHKKGSRRSLYSLGLPAVSRVSEIRADQWDCLARDREIHNLMLMFFFGVEQVDTLHPGNPNLGNYLVPTLSNTRWEPFGVVCITPASMVSIGILTTDPFPVLLIVTKLRLASEIRSYCPAGRTLPAAVNSNGISE
jgi:hypothetical protein